jgi:hypothetical protein
VRAEKNHGAILLLAVLSAFQGILWGLSVCFGKLNKTAKRASVVRINPNFNRMMQMFLHHAEADLYVDCLIREAKLGYTSSGKTNQNKNIFCYNQNHGIVNGVLNLSGDLPFQLFSNLQKLGSPNFKCFGINGEYRRFKKAIRARKLLGLGKRFSCRKIQFKGAPLFTNQEHVFSLKRQSLQNVIRIRAAHSRGGELISGQTYFFQGSNTFLSKHKLDRSSLTIRSNPLPIDHRLRIDDGSVHNVYRHSRLWLLGDGQQNGSSRK